MFLRNETDHIIKIIYIYINVLALFKTIQNLDLVVDFSTTFGKDGAAVSNIMTSSKETPYQKKLM